MSIKQYIPFYRRNIKVAFPIVLTQLGGGIVSMVDNIMVGHLGTMELAAAAFANSIFIIALVFSMGSTMGLTPVVGESYVQDKHERVGKLLQNALLFTLIIAVFICGLLLVCYPFMDKMGQVPEVVSLAKPYYLIQVISLFPFLYFCTFKQFLEGLGNTKIAMVITIIANVVNIIFNYLLIYGKFGFPQWGVFGAGVATLIARALMPIMFFVAVRFRKTWWQYFDMFRWRKFDRKYCVEVARVGLPIGGHMLLECSAFAISGIMVGWIGAVELAANQIAQNMSHMAFMVVVGIASATTIRVSHQLGVKDFHALRMAGNASVHLCLLSNAIMATLLIAFRHQIPFLYTNDPAVVAVASQLLILAGLFQLSDGLQAVGAGILRGMSDVNKPMEYAFIAYICINLPVGYLLAFPLGFGVSGIWMGFIFGLSVAAFLFHRRCHYRIKQLETEYIAKKGR